MIDRLLLWPYWLTLKTRNYKYRGGRHTVQAEVPTICIGNVTVGGTGKTPHTEMVVRTLIDMDGPHRHIAVLSRGYKRKSKGFQQVSADGSAAFYGDEPLQMKVKFPNITVALEKDRIAGCKYLCHPDFVKVLARNRKCRNKEFPRADVIILDDAMQYRRLAPTLTIALVNSSRPVFEDKLLPLGRLRDLPERIYDADAIIVTKCPTYTTDMDKEEWAERLGLKEFSLPDCSAVTPSGKTVHLFFTSIGYATPVPVFPEADRRYTYSGQAVAFSGIADDTPFLQYLSGLHQVMGSLRFPDHHKFGRGDIASILSMSKKNPLALVATTEKDAQRMRDAGNVPAYLRERMFYIPIEVSFIGDEEHSVFAKMLSGAVNSAR